MSDKDDKKETFGSEKTAVSTTSGSEADYSTAVVDAEDVPEPEFEVGASPPEPPPQLTGKYTLKQGDTPFSVALEMYGRGSRGGELARANRKVPWKAGNVINL